MSSKKTKGKQKINIERIEKDDDRMVTLSKRRSGIYTKLSELSIRCGADVGFLVHSNAGKPYTFGSPSFEAVAKRFLNGNGSSSSSIVDAHRKLKIEELCKEYNSTVEKANVEEEKRAAVTASSLPVDRNSWWKINPMEEEEDEEVRQMMEKYEGFYEKLCEEIAKRGGASSSLARN